MKKCLIILLSLCTTLSLTSCKALDNMREQYATISEDRRTISHMGNEYAVVEIEGLKHAYLYYGSSMHVCKEGVPVLLSEFYGQYGSINVAKTLIEFDGQVFALESEKEYVKNCMKDARYALQVYDSAEDVPMLDRARTELVSELLCQSATYPERGQWDEGVLTEGCVSIVLCDEKRYVCSDSWVEIFQGSVDGKEGIFLSDGNKGIYEIPEEESAYFKEFLEKCRETINMGPEVVDELLPW